MKKNATIKDIAKYLNVSTSTVSRALSDTWDVKPETRNRVLLAAEELNYRPNPIAIRLRRGRTKVIGVVIPEFLNSFFPKVIMGFQSVLDAEGYQLLITQSNESSENEAKNLKLLVDNLVDGILISITQEGKNSDLYQQIIDDGTPLIFFNRTCPFVNTPKVIINDYEMAFSLVEHLIQMGYKKISHLSGPESISITAERKRGYIDALIKHKMPVDEKLIISAGVLEDKGYEAMHYLLDNKIAVDAVFAFNDPIAIGAMIAIKERKLRIPKDIAVAGFSESRSALLVEPKLTSVAQPLFEMGAAAARLMLDRLKPNAILSKNPIICLSAKLNIRESTMRLK